MRLLNSSSTSAIIIGSMSERTPRSSRFSNGVKMLSLIRRYSLEQSYYSRSDLAHCIIVWFMALAFLDGAFEDIRVPAEIFNRRNNTGSGIPIKIKKVR